MRAARYAFNCASFPCAPGDGVNGVNNEVTVLTVFLAILGSKAGAGRVCVNTKVTDGGRTCGWAVTTIGRLVVTVGRLDSLEAGFSKRLLTRATFPGTPAESGRPISNTAADRGRKGNPAESGRACNNEDRALGGAAAFTCTAADIVLVACAYPVFISVADNFIAATGTALTAAVVFLAKGVWGLVDVAFIAGIDLVAMGVVAGTAATTAGVVGMVDKVTE